VRSLKKLLPPALVLAAFAVAIATLLTDHSDAYGTVALPAGGALELPEGQATVFVEEPGSIDGSNELSLPLRFEVYPAGGGAPLPKEATGKESTSTVFNKRSQEMGEAGSVAEVDVPAAGTYLVSGRFGKDGPLDASVPVELEFGDDPFSALARKSTLLAILLGGAILIWLLPMPRYRQQHWQDEIAEQGAR
jgi:hypothetical protein